MCNQCTTAMDKKQAVWLIPLIDILIVVIVSVWILNQTQAVSNTISITTSSQDTQNNIPVFQPILNITAYRG